MLTLQVKGAGTSGLVHLGKLYIVVQHLIAYKRRHCQVVTMVTKKNLNSGGKKDQKWGHMYVANYVKIISCLI